MFSRLWGFWLVLAKKGDEMVIRVDRLKTHSHIQWAISYFSTASHVFNTDLGLTAESTVHLPKRTWQSIFGSCSKLSEGETVDRISYNMKIQNATHLNLNWDILQCTYNFRVYDNEHLWKRTLEFSKLLLLLLNWGAKGQHFIKYAIRHLARHWTTLH